ncbi:GNAT family N-acetyltransferase [Ferruginibacter sp.]
MTKNETAHRFEMDVDGQIAIIVYEETHFKMTLLHTEVPPALEGKGAATAIIEKTLEYIEKNHYRLVPLCPMVVAYIKRHPEWKMILDESVRDNY